MTNKADKIDEAIKMTLNALEYSETEVPRSQLIKAKVTCDGVEKY